ncbi:MAG: sugar ABC transporter ATP-binding protein [Eubacteriales bacterium]
MSINDNPEFVLELDKITKIFPGVKAIDQVSLKLKPGEVLALVGENGAGKSTLINCITGVLSPEEGDIYVNGKLALIKNPQASAKLGISVVHQERNLIPTFDVAENIFFDKICGKGTRRVDRKWMHENARPLLQRVKLDLDPAANVENLSSAQKQLIEIARALSNHSHILLLDEPTASISIREAEMLLEIIRELKQQGVAIIYVSHKLEEIFAIADRVKVIRDGKSVGEAVVIQELTNDKLVEMMVGSREMKQAFPSKDNSDATKVLEAFEITSKNNNTPASFYLKKGEILGWYGLVGAGRTELAREIIGIDPIRKGHLKVNGKEVRIRSYKEAFEKHGIYYMSENRKEEGLFLIHSIATNVTIVALKRIKNKIGLNSFTKEKALTKEYAEQLQIKMGSPDDVISSLSGGNQQKICVAKCLMTNPEIIIADEPTVGIDVKTKAEIHKLIYELSQQGKSIILISSDLPELIQIAERILVFSKNRIVGELENMKDYDSMSALVMNSIIST